MRIRSRRVASATLLSLWFAFLPALGFATGTATGNIVPTDNPATQRAWMVNLADALGLSYGLPSNPQDRDYLELFSGQRHYRFEAEEIYDPDDRAFVSTLVSYGRFSGSGWLSATSEPTIVHLRFLLPRSGHYQVTAIVRRTGHRFQIGNQTLTGTAGSEQLGAILLGEVGLHAGEQEVVVVLPPDGGLDAITLEATALPPVAPRGGWQLDAPLSTGEMAVCSIQALGLESLLPLTDQELLFEAETIGRADGAAITAARFLGAPSGGHWLRAGAGGATVTLTITPPAAGVYRVSLRALADAPLNGTIAGGYRLRATFPPYLDNQVLGDFSLPATPCEMVISLPPGAGIDALLLQRHAAAEADYLRLAGLPGGATVATAELNRFLALLATLAPVH